MSNALKVLPYLSLLSMGFVLLRYLKFRGYGYEWISVSVLTGLFVQSWGMFVAGLAGIPFSREVLTSVDLFFVIWAVVEWIKAGRGNAAAFPTKHTEKSSALSRNLFYFSLAALGAYAVMHAVINGERLVSFTDAVMSYDFRAQAIAYEGTIRPAIYNWPEVRTPNFIYPPLVTLFHAHYYVMGGANPKLIYSVFLFAVSGVVAGGVFRLTGRKLLAVWAAGLMAFLPVCRKFSLLEALDLPALCYYGLGFTCLVLWARERTFSHLFIAAIGFAGVAFIRPEDPLFMAGLIPVIFFYFGFRKEGWTTAALIVGLYTLVWLSHEYFLRHLIGVHAEQQLNFSWAVLFSPERILKALWAFMRHFTSDRFMLLGPLTLTLACFSRAEDREGRLILYGLASFCVCWFLLLMIDNASDWEEMRLDWSYFRIFIRIAPLLVLYVLRHPLVLKGLSEWTDGPVAEPLRRPNIN